MAINENNEFNNAFNGLDKILKDMYPCNDNSKLGVTRYLEDMKQKSIQGKNRIPNWELDYKRLSELRNKRNEMVHEIGFDHNIFVASDTHWINNFKSKILSHCDPIAELHKIQSAERIHYQKQKNYIKSNNTYHTQPQHKNSNGCAFVLLVGLCIFSASFLLTLILFLILSST